MNGYSSSILNFQNSITLRATQLPIVSLNSITKSKITFSSAPSPKSQLQDSTDNSESSGKTAKKPSGFGTTSDSNPTTTKKNSNKRGKEIIRRNPIGKPSATKEVSGNSSAGEISGNENAFLLTWLGLGLLIFVEGIALSASGFLPDEWDNFLVKILYPSFTPTVFLFVGGTVIYGVIKYLETEKMKN